MRETITFTPVGEKLDNINTPNYIYLLFFFLMEQFIESLDKIYFTFIEYHIWYIRIFWLIYDSENMEEYGE